MLSSNLLHILSAKRSKRSHLISVKAFKAARQFPQTHAEYGNTLSPLSATVKLLFFIAVIIKTNQAVLDTELRII